MKKVVAALVLMMASAQAFADAGKLYTCQWNSHSNGVFTVQKSSAGFCVVKSDETGYFVAKDSPEAQNLNLEIRAEMVSVDNNHYQLQVQTYNDSFHAATCW